MGRCTLECRNVVRYESRSLALEGRLLSQASKQDSSSRLARRMLVYREGGVNSRS